MCLDLSSPHDACQRRKIKRNRGKNFDSLHESKYIKVKDRPFAEGSRGCHALLWLDAQNLNAKERHFILPLVIWTFIMQSVAFIASITRSYKAIFFTPKNHTYLESNFYCLHR